jgi:acyl-CoA synthetase (AMP-forming)/AMP-acid ligase II/thioesterase domain-containing protein/acyl carrier protein
VQPFVSGAGRLSVLRQQSGQMTQPHDFLIAPNGSTSQTIGDVIEYHAAQRPAWPALVCSNCPPLSFLELRMHIRSIRDQLRVAGIGPSARVGIMLPKGPEAALLGVSIAASAISIPLNPMLNPRELENEFSLLGLDALILPGWQRSAAREVAHSNCLTILEAHKTGQQLSSISLEHDKASVPGPTNLEIFDSTALLLRTSGTTGTAKLVRVTHRNLLAMASKMQQWFNLSVEDRCACILPTYYAQGYKSALLVPLLLGSSVALPSSQDPDDLAEWFRELRPTWFSAGPTYLQALLDRLRSKKTGLEHSLRFILSSSSYLPEPVRTELENRLEIPVLEFYGLSEAGVMAANPSPPAKRKPGTAGAIPSGELAIRDEAGNFLSAGEVGGIVVRGPSVTPGYADAINGRTTDFRRDWMETGDLGFIDSEGFLTLVGRTKEIINRGGEKISPYEIEKALLIHPGVRDAAAFAVPHPRLGENVAAAVVLQPGADATSSDLKSFLNDRLAPFKIPQRIFIRGELPRGTNGKILRSQLASAVSTHARRIISPGSMLEFQIAAIWQKLVGHNDIGVEDDFFELGGDSLMATEMLLEVEAFIGKRLPQSSLGAATTIRQLANVVMQTVPVSEDLVTCAQQGTGVPFFFCHGDLLTRGFYGLRLAKLLGHDQPVYLLHPFREADFNAGTSMEAMARSYVTHLLHAQPSGAFRLGGFCNGGLLAWEIAHQLASRGRIVEKVVVIDVPSLNARPTFRAIGRMLQSRVLAGSKIRNDMCAVWDRARRIDSGKGFKEAERKALPLEWQPAALESASKFYPVMTNYIPPKIDSAIYCILCEEYRHKREYSPSAWRHLGRVVHYEAVPGEHHNCVTIHLSSLANVLRGILSESIDQRGTKQIAVG